MLHPGEGIEWRCAYVNNSNMNILGAPGPQGVREHCLLFGAYYPTETPQEAIDCVRVHDDDDQTGGDVVTRALVP